MLDREDYYLVNDPDLGTSTLRYGIHFLRRNWNTGMLGRPTVTAIIQRYHLGSVNVYVCVRVVLSCPYLLFYT